MDEGTKIGVSFNNDVKNMNILTKYERELSKIYSFIKGLENPKSKKALEDIDKNIEKIKPELNQTNKETSNFNSTLKSAFKIGSVVAFTKAVEKLATSMMKLSQKSVEYIENVNLLEVAYKNANETIDESSKRIETYIDKMSEVYGFDESRLTRQFGIFKQLANAMQLPTETAEHLSEIMVKMSTDIASLYNLPLDRATNALQSALAGQVRPIRSATGADITEKTLQNTVADLGLDRTISELSYVEKRLVMVVSLTNQLKNSQGDYARTIESASNQIRVMHEQWDRLSRSVGNVFYPILEKVLPYINAVLMVLTEIFNLIASLVGFKMPEFDYSGLTGVSDIALDIEEELGGAGEAVDKLASKLKGLRNFDKLNVINTPSKNGSAGGFGSGYVDPKIMDAFNNAFSDYNDMMDKVQMKATKIRDSIMEWLGFTKQVDDETGEISWKFDHLTFGTILGGLVVGGSIFSGVKGILGMFTKITGLKSPVWLNGLLAIGGGIVGGELLSLGLQKVGESKGWEGAGIFDIYREKDMFSIWKEDIIPGYKQMKEEQKQAEEQWNDLYRQMFATLIMGEDTGNQNLVSAIGKQIETTTWGDFRNAQYYKKYRSLYKNDRDYFKLGSFFNKEDATNVNDYATALSKYFDLIKDNTVSIDNFKSIMDDSNDSILNTTQDIELMLTQMGSEYFTLTAENLQKLNGYFQQLEIATKTSSQAFLDAVTLSISKLQEQGYVSDETAQKVIDNAYRKKLAEEGETREYIEAMLDLQHQFENNQITQEEYYNKAVELYNTFKKQPSVVDKFRRSIDVFNTNLKITGKNWTEVKNATDTARDAHKKATDEIKLNTQQQIDMYTEWLSQVDEGTEEYKNITDTIIALNKQQTDDLQRTDDAYALFLLNLVEQITDSKEEITTEAKKTRESYVKELNAMGMDVDLTQGRDNILSQVDSIKNNIESRNPKLTVKVDADTSEAENKLDLLKNAINYGLTTVSSSLFKVFSHAEGDLPPVGQLMVVNEKGPELVGQIGGQSFVANQNQIVDFLDRKIGNAQNNMSKPSIINIYLDAEHKIGSYTLDQLQQIAKTNGSAITIGG